METATRDGVCTWKFGDQLWQQTSDGRFSLESIAGIRASGSAIDLDYLAGAQPAPDSPAHYLPAAFQYCPQSGARLPAPPWDAQNHWLPPYGDGSGSRVIADGESSSAQFIVGSIFQCLHGSGTRDLSASKKIVEAPGKNGLSFLVADAGGYRDALFSLARNGALHLWLRGSNKWQLLQPEGVPIGRVDLDNWAWSIALLPGQRGHDLLIPGSDGPVLVSIDALPGKYRTQHYQGKSLAGAGRLAGRYWLPVAMSGAGLQLVGRDEKGWNAIPVANAPHEPVELLSAPIADPASGRLLWIGKSGYLSLSQDALKAQWQSWPNGASAEPQLGPPFRDGNGLWQLISEPESDYYVQLDSQATDRSEPIKGFRLSTGHLSFKYNIRLDIPWNEDHDEHRNPMTEQVVYPFIEFRRGKYLLALRDKSESRMKTFFSSTDPLHVQYCLEEIDGVRLSLDAVVREPWKAQWFFYDNAMWLYIDSSGALYRWDA